MWQTTLFGLFRLILSRLKLLLLLGDRIEEAHNCPTTSANSRTTDARAIVDRVVMYLLSWRCERGASRVRPRARLAPRDPLRGVAPAAEIALCVLVALCALRALHVFRGLLLLPSITSDLEACPAASKKSTRHKCVPTFVHAQEFFPAPIRSSLIFFSRSHH